MAQQIKFWSYSTYSTYKQCPFKLKCQKIDKIPEPKGEPLVRGIEIHEKAQHYIEGQGRNIPKELKNFDSLFKRLRKRYKKPINGMIVEDMWAYTKDWGPTHWKDWNGCWLRVKIDCGEHQSDTVLIVYDWKTGKFRPEQNGDYVEQLELYGLTALLENPHVDKVICQLVYLDVGVTYPAEGDPEISFERKDVPKLKKLWEKRVAPMLKDKMFAPRPNQFCPWCHFRKSNAANGGGQCKF